MENVDSRMIDIALFGILHPNGKQFFTSIFVCWEKRKKILVKALPCFAIKALLNCPTSLKLH